VEPIAVEYPASIRVSGAEVALRPRESGAIARNAWPERIEVSLRCADCGRHSRGAAHLEFVYCDDDHYARTELGFSARPQSACPNCRTPLAADVTVTVTRYADDSAEVAWDAVSSSRSIRTRLM
jgi:hypothetical protein